jgi:hypothetical protein
MDYYLFTMKKGRFVLMNQNTILQQGVNNEEKNVDIVKKSGKYDFQILVWEKDSRANYFIMTCYDYVAN